MKILLPLIFLSTSAHALSIQQNGIGKQDITVSTITIPNLSNGSVIFSSGSTIWQDNPNLYYDATNKRLGLQTNSPGTTFHAVGTSSNRAILANSPSPNMSLTSGVTAAEIATFATQYSGTAASMLDILAYSTSTPQAAGPMFRISNHWENSGGLSSSGTIAIGSYVGSTFTDVLYVTTQNAVGINQPFPAYQLDVSSSARFVGQAIVQGTMSVAGNAFSVGASTFVVTGGNVGIGTTGPLGPLDVVSGTNEMLFVLFNATSTLRLISPSGGGQVIRLTESGVSNRWVLGTKPSDGNFYLTPGSDMVTGTPNVTVQNGGNVGIGTASPGTTLDINGNAQFGNTVIKSSATAAGYFRLPVRTQVQIDATTPGGIGELLMCSNCTTANTLCVSTGTAVAQYRASHSTTVGCGSNN